MGVVSAVLRLAIDDGSIAPCAMVHGYLQGVLISIHRLSEHWDHYRIFPGLIPDTIALL